MSYFVSYTNRLAGGGNGLGNTVVSMNNSSKKNTSKALRKIVYLEDEQGYSTTPVLFKTNCEWPICELERLSWSELGAGRRSTSFNGFHNLLVAKGFSCELIQRYPRDSAAPAGFELVKGATGNY